LNNPTQNIASLDNVIQHAYDGVLSSSETDRIIALQPQGVMILAETDDQYSTAQLLRAAGILTIGISSARREENIPEEFDYLGRPPEIVVRATWSQVRARESWYTKESFSFFGTASCRWWLWLRF
jgi:hypothetical protein